MSALRPRVRASIVGVAAFALVAVAAGGTFAASNPATLYACYDAYGNVRMGDTAQCKLPGGGRLVNWSTVGVAGPVGPTGPTGPTGPIGATGPSGAIGLVGREVVQASGHLVMNSPAFGNGVVVHCPAGKVAISGGGDGSVYEGPGATGFIQPAVLLKSIPGATFWTIALGLTTAFTGQTLTWNAYVVCVTPAP